MHTFWRKDRKNKLGSFPAEREREKSLPASFHGGQTLWKNKQEKRKEK